MNKMINALLDQFLTGQTPAALFAARGLIGDERLHILAALLIEAIALDELPLKVDQEWRWCQDLRSVLPVCAELNALFALEGSVLGYASGVSQPEKVSIRDQVVKRYTPRLMI
jgi:hypothetical protein